MLDMGFAEDLEAILDGDARRPPDRALLGDAPATHRRRSPSATSRPGPDQRSRRARAGGRGAAGPPGRVCRAARADKLAALCRLLDMEDPTSALVFCRTRGEVDDLAEALSGRGHRRRGAPRRPHAGAARSGHGPLPRGSLDVLVATDVAARGLDIEHVSPRRELRRALSPDAYVHRIGRPGAPVAKARDHAGRAARASAAAEHRAATSTKLEIGRLPTVADLRERRLDMLRATLREAVLGDGLDRYRAVVEPLTDEFDLVDIALAAVRLADSPDGQADEEELPTPSLPPDRPASASRGRSSSRDRTAAAGRGGSPATWSDRSGGPPTERGTKHGPTGTRGRRLADQEPTTRLFVGAGRAAGMRPSDLVGAIANEAGLAGDRIGSIQIAEGFSLVEVPEAEADRVIAALRAGSVKGRRINVRRERY